MAGLAILFGRGVDAVGHALPPKQPSMCGTDVFCQIRCHIQTVRPANLQCKFFLANPCLGVDTYADTKFRHFEEQQ
jgi:hypothetical protein